jgi:predicted TPR repeat methyltransferase
VETDSSAFQLCGKCPAIAAGLVQDAMNRQKAGDLEGAVKGYREFLKIDPKATQIRSNWALPWRTGR